MIHLSAYQTFEAALVVGCSRYLVTVALHWPRTRQVGITFDQVHVCRQQRCYDDVTQLPDDADDDLGTSDLYWENQRAREYRYFCEEDVIVVVVASGDAVVVVVVVDQLSYH